MHNLQRIYTSLYFISKFQPVRIYSGRFSGKKFYSNSIFFSIEGIYNLSPLPKRRIISIIGDTMVQSLLFFSNVNVLLRRSGFNFQQHGCHRVIYYRTFCMFKFRDRWLCNININHVAFVRDRRAENYTLQALFPYDVA